MRNFYTKVVDYRKIILIVFLLMAACSAVLKPFVGVNYDIKSYLPEDTASTVALKEMESSFDGGVPNAKIMLKDVTVSEALSYKEKLSNVSGVESVSWLDDSTLDIAMPISMIDKDTLDTYYRVDNEHSKTGDALMTLTIGSEKNLEACTEIREIIGEDNCFAGDAAVTAAATESTVSEIAKVIVIAVLFVIFVLILTTNSWMEPVIIMIGLGVAIIINMGTNIIFGEISFVTNASGSILQLAVSLDYSVFLLHRYEECRKAMPGDSPRDVMIEALCRSTGSVLSSGVTTVIGFLALCFMRFGIGPDMGLALAKGVAISLITVFVFVPALTLMLDRYLERFMHKRFMPDFKGIAGLIRKAIIPMAVLFTILIVPSFILSNHNEYYYGASHIMGPDTKIGSDAAEIEKVFGESDMYALLVPKGDHASEKKIVDLLEEQSEVKSVTSLVGMLGNSVPEDIVPSFIRKQLSSDKYSRIVISAGVPSEGEEAFALVEKVRVIAEEYYGDEYHLAGGGVSTYDLRDTVTSDLMKINLIAIAAVLIVLIIMFRKLLLPVILVVCIETAIWINLAVPAVSGSIVFYIAYLMISTIQLGATVDYAILMTERYRESRLSMNRSDSVKETVRIVLPSVLTSGSALVVVGFLMGVMSSHGIIAQLGIFIGRGALCSLIVVLFVLPGFLYLFDRFCVDRPVRIPGIYDKGNVQ